ncbi:MAG: hypothetical protein KKE61_04125 [Proteobacteria bacterium]|nr:hypothetical protein [Pseudomonadota bacterium]
MWKLGLIIGVGFLFFLIFKIISKGPVRTLEHICFYIEVLLKRGLNNGFLIVEISKTDYFLQFRKYINKPGDYGIELYFPDTVWSHSFVEGLIRLCKNEQITHKIEKKTPGIEFDFICVDFKKDTQKAQSFMKKVFFEIFKIDDNKHFYYRFENISAKDISNSLKNLLRHGQDGWFLIITVAYTKKFIQLRKYNNSLGEYGLELYFGKAKWSIVYFERLEHFCKQNKIKFIILKKDSLDFLCVDFGKNIKDANDFVKMILFEIFQLEKTVKLFIRLEKAIS